jgi:thiamine biosynthesis lipoprotein
VVLPAGCHLDLGGIGKGRCADLLAAELLAAGALGACVDLGGDVRVAGRTSTGGDDWVVAVDEPFHPGEDLALVQLADGAVTTSSRAKRRWGSGPTAGHHLIDPATGRPAETDLLAVTVVAASAAWGEVHAKAALVAGARRGRALLEAAGMCGLLVAADGTCTPAGPIGDFLVAGPPT